MQLAEQQVSLFELSEFMDANRIPDTGGASAVIGPEGGMVIVTDPASPIYGASLKVPAGALDTPVKITLREGDHNCDFGFGPSINLLPCGVNFKRAAILTVYLDDPDEQGDDFDGSVPAFYHYDESSDAWTHNGAVRLERLGNALMCELHHL